MTHVVLFELTVGDDVSNADEILQETLTQTRAFPGNEGFGCCRTPPTPENT